MTPDLANRLDHDLAAADQAARAAAKVLEHAVPATVRSKTNPRDLVTEWDDHSETIIRAALAHSTPTIPIIGEEQGTARDIDLDRDWYWLVDPIDGTVNFAHGLPMWAISIGLMHGRVAMAGVVAAPAMGWWFSARQGGGARSVVRGVEAAMRVSSIAQFDQALLATGFPYDLATSADNNLAAWEHMQRTATACRRVGSASLDLCMVAMGWFDGYWERKLKPWDVAAGAVIVSEAGGCVTNTTGGSFDPHKAEIVASNGAIHKALVDQLALVPRSRER
ncbi:MAG: inositol monophosphatase [Kofleriaceae bacterium]|nr:inositol monophosphatase [Kofleriaceae bacterium]